MRDALAAQPLLQYPTPASSNRDAMLLCRVALSKVGRHLAHMSGETSQDCMHTNKVHFQSRRRQRSSACLHDLHQIQHALIYVTVLSKACLQVSEYKERTSLTPPTGFDSSGHGPKVAKLHSRCAVHAWFCCRRS